MQHCYDLQHALRSWSYGVLLDTLRLLPHWGCCLVRSTLVNVCWLAQETATQLPAASIAAHAPLVEGVVVILRACIGAHRQWLLQLLQEASQAAAGGGSLPGAMELHWMR